MTITTRAGKGSALTHAEMDANWSTLQDSSAISFLQTGSGAVSRPVQDKERDVVDPVDYGGTGERQPIRLARSMGHEFYDDFLRENTSAGSIGTPAMGTAYQLLGVNTAAPATQTNLSGCRWISAAGDICYATQTLSGNVWRIGATVSWTTGNGGSDPGVLALLVGPTQTAGDLADNLALHLIITRTAWTLQTYTTGSPTTVASGSFSPTLSLSTPYTFEVTFGRNTAHYELPQGVSGDCTSAAFVTHAGKYATWEHYYASSSVSELVRAEAVWAGSAPAPLSSLYEDASGLVTLNGSAFADISGNARRFYSGGTSGFVFRNAAGNTTIATLSDAGAFVATTSLAATTTVTAAAGSGYYLGGSLFVLAAGTRHQIYGLADGLRIYDNSGSNIRFDINSSGVVTVANLAGTGSRTVVADANGVLSAP